MTYQGVTRAPELERAKQAYVSAIHVDEDITLPDLTGDGGWTSVQNVYDGYRVLVLSQDDSNISNSSW